MVERLGVEPRSPLFEKEVTDHYNTKTRELEGCGGLIVNGVFSPKEVTVDMRHPQKIFT